MKVYRVENEAEQKGLWRKFDGTWEPLFDMLTDGLCRDMPMDDNPLYRAEGKQWFASAPSKETLQKWFSKRDLEELLAAGFTVSEFEVSSWKKVSDYEYIFTRDNIISRTDLKVSDIYPEIDRVIEEGVTSVKEWLPGIYVVQTKKAEEDLKDRVRNGEINTGTNVFVPDYIKQLNEKYRDVIEETNKALKGKRG